MSVDTPEHPDDLDQGPMVQRENALTRGAARLLQDPEAVDIINRLRFLGYSPEQVGRAMGRLTDGPEVQPRMPYAPGAWWFWSFVREEWTKGSVQYRDSKLVSVGNSGFDMPVSMCIWGGRASQPPVCSPAEAALEQKRDFEYETRLAREHRRDPS